MKKFLILIVSILCYNVAVCQQTKILSFKAYDKTISFTDDNLDAWYGTYKRDNKVLSKNQDLAYTEYIAFKSRVSDGNRKNEFLQFDRLNHVFFTSAFDESYFITDRSEAYKKALKNSRDKQSFKKLMQVRGAIVSGVQEQVINNLH
ncbi:hypothetical protein [Flavobacterium sp.]|uniref:hypothetical protein n=1 Tax=Flavobacterium sp. TaxID=239 RepID=UPI002ED936B8